MWLLYLLSVVSVCCGQFEQWSVGFFKTLYQSKTGFFVVKATDGMPAKSLFCVRVARLIVGLILTWQHCSAASHFAISRRFRSDVAGKSEALSDRDKESERELAQWGGCVGCLFTVDIGYGRV